MSKDSVKRFGTIVDSYSGESSFDECDDGAYVLADDYDKLEAECKDPKRDIALNEAEIMSLTHQMYRLREALESIRPHAGSALNRSREIVLAIIDEALKAPAAEETK